MRQHADAVIIGGGIIGSAIAYYMAKAGAKPVLLEKDRLSSQASQAAAGMLAAQAEMKESGPMYEMARKSRGMFPALSDQLKEASGIDIHLVNRGMLKLALSEEEADEIQHMIKFQRASGENVSWLTAEQVRELEPGVSDQVLGAMHVPTDGHVEAPDLSIAFAKAAAALGAEIHEFEEVHRIQTDGKRVTGVVTALGEYTTDKIVVTAGAWSSQLLQHLNVHLPAYPVKGEVLSVIRHKPLLKMTLFSEGCYLVPKKGGRLLVGATVVPKTFDRSVTVSGITRLLERATMILPEIRDTEWEKAWTGLRPQTPDGLPYLGEHPDWQGLYAATGHFRNGILLSPFTGKLMADLLMGGQTGMDLTPFRLDRFETVQQ